MTQRGPRGALLSPLSWAALAVLVINDHVLKGAGILPGEVTGKLSDLAGMIVAPVLAVAVLDLRGRAAKAAAFTAIAFAFAVLELSPAAAATWDRALGAIGIPSRSWADPSDLIGLAMLPLAWWLVRERAVTRPGIAGLDRAIQRTALALGIVACVATSGPPPPAPQWTTGAWIHNRTAETIDVRLRWAEAELSCALLDDVDLGAAAGPAIFGEGVTFRLEPGATVPIEPDDARAALGGMPDGTRNECELVRVSIDGLDDTVVFWERRDEGFVSTVLAADAETVPPGRLSVLATADGIALEHDDAYRSAPLLERAPPAGAGCEEPGEGIAYSDLDVLGTESWTVVGRTLLADGCTELELGPADPSGEAIAIFLCVPGDFVPFEVGDVIGRERVDAEGLVGLRSAGASLRLGRGVDSVVMAFLTIELEGLDLDCGVRVSCDAFVVPARLTRGGAPVEIGTPFAVIAAEHTGQMLIARAEQVVLAPPGCGGGRTDAGTRIDVVIRLDSTTEVP